ncbi:MAG: hypothetical protein IPL74_17305 [Bacteroidetes bacterium]|nr:hypothetical protein [Bacteroidota bacterium]
MEQFNVQIQTGSANFDRDLAFGPIVGDSATFDDYEVELKYAFKNYLYELLKANDSLLSLGLSTDSSFQRFYSEMDASISVVLVPYGGH